MWCLQTATAGQARFRKKRFVWCGSVVSNARKPAGRPGKLQREAHRKDSHAARSSPGAISAASTSRRSLLTSLYKGESRLNPRTRAAARDSEPARGHAAPSGPQCPRGRILHPSAVGIAIEGFEMLKGLEGVHSHRHREWVPILGNSQDIPQPSRIAYCCERMVAGTECV